MAQFLLKDTAIALGVLIVGGVGLKALTGKSFEAETFEEKIDIDDFNKVADAIQAVGQPATVLFETKFGTPKIVVVLGDDIYDDENVEIVLDILDDLKIPFNSSSLVGDTTTLERKEYDKLRKINGGHKDFLAESFEAEVEMAMGAETFEADINELGVGDKVKIINHISYRVKHSDIGKIGTIVTKYDDERFEIIDNDGKYHTIASYDLELYEDKNAETFNSDSYYPQEKFIWKINNIEYDWENEPEYFEDYYFSKLTVGVIVDSSEEGSGLHGIQFSTKQSPENILKIVKNKIERFASHLTNQSVKVISFDEELYDIIDISTPSISADEYNNGIEGVFGHLQTEYPYEAEAFNADEDDEESYLRYRYGEPLENISRGRKIDEITTALQDISSEEMLITVINNLSTKRANQLLNRLMAGIREGWIRTQPFLNDAESFNAEKGGIKGSMPYHFNSDEDDENKRNIFVYEAYRDTINTFIGRFNTLEEAENYIYNEWINEVNDYLQEARSRKEGTYISPLTKDLLKEKKEKGVLDWTERDEKYLKAQQSWDSQPLSDEQKDNLQYHEDNIDRWVSEWKIVSQTPKGSIQQNPDYSRPELPYKMYEGYSQRYRDGYGNFPYIIFDPNFNPIGEE